jgi:Matrixin
LKPLVIGLACLTLSTAAVAQDARYKWLRLEGHQVRWQAATPAEAPIVRYRVLSEGADFPGARNCRRMTSPGELLASSGIDTVAFARELEAAFAMWQAAANISFRKAEPDEAADIVIGAQAEPEGWAFADVFYNTGPGSQVRPISRSLICLNPLKRWKVGFNGNLGVYDLRYTLAHEIGHAIGLDHPDGGLQIMGHRYLEQFRELQAGDIAGAIKLYGQRPQLAEESVAVAPAPAETAPVGTREDAGFALGSTRALDADPRLAPR